MSVNRKQTFLSTFGKRLAIAAGLMLVVAAAYAARQSAEQTTNNPPTGDAVLNGRWKLNRDESDDPGEKLRSAMQDRDQNGPMGGHGGMGGGGVNIGIPGIGGIGGMGGPRGPGSHRGSGAGSEEQRTRLRDLVQASDQLKIVQKGPEIDVTDADSRVRSLFTDGRKIEKAKKDSRQEQVKAHWDHGTLVTEEKGPNGEKISHAYEITGDGKQMADTLTLESKHLNTPIIVRSIYDKAEPDRGK